MCGVDGLPGVVRRANVGGGGAPYGVYACCKKSFGT
jgi:hypothetical protein